MHFILNYTLDYDSKAMSYGCALMQNTMTL